MIPGKAARVRGLCFWERGLRPGKVGLATQFADFVCYLLRPVPITIASMNGPELLTRYRLAGSEAAFADLLRRFTNLVYSIAKRRVANTSLAEEVTQTVFTRLAKTPPNLKSEGELIAWLHRTTIHVAIDAWRSETRRRAREQEAVLMQPTHDEDARLWEAMTPHLDEALDQLPDDDRQAVLLRFFEQMAMRDIGGILGVNEDAAKMRVKRALDRLRDQLARRGVVCTIAGLLAVIAPHAVAAAPSHLLANLVAMKLARPGAAVATGTSSALLQAFRSKMVVGASALAVLIALLVVFQRHPDQREVEAATQPVASPAPPVDSKRAKFFSKPLLGKRQPVPEVQQPPRFILRAIDQATGLGLAGAKIKLAYFYVGGVGEGHTTQTDAAGNGPIPEPNQPEKEPGMNVFVSLAGYVPKCVNFRGTDSRKDYVLELEPALAVGGTVMDEQGLPVAGVELKGQRASSDPFKNGGPTTDFQTCAVKTDASGRWHFPYVPKSYGEIRFYLSCTNYAVASASVPVGKPESLNTTLIIERGFVLLGRVVNAENRPIVGATVKERHEFGFRKLSTTTDHDGCFAMQGLGLSRPAVRRSSNPAGQPAETSPSKPEQTMDIVVLADGMAPQQQTVQFREPTNHVQFVLNRGSVFRGRVVDEEGNAITGAVVRTDYDFKNQRPTRFEWLVNTDTDGRFEWHSAPAEAICFWFEAKGYEVIRGFPILPDGTDHEIKLQRKGPATTKR